MKLESMNNEKLPVLMKLFLAKGLDNTEIYLFRYSIIDRENNEIIENGDSSFDIDFYKSLVKEHLDALKQNNLEVRLIKGEKPKDNGFKYNDFPDSVYKELRELNGEADEQKWIKVVPRKAWAIDDYYTEKYRKQSVQK